jgi:hypothetical protein
MVGGSFEVESAPGHGTSIAAKIPSGNAARVEAPLMDSAGTELERL